jgi:thiamine-phosphate pyrophosphorylase
MNGPVLRLLDANANRAREALRVAEDYARFVLDDDALSGRLKELRHELTRCVSPYLPAAILHRDTPGDVGTDNKTQAEGIRQDLAAVVTAAGKRLGEALRVIEEVLKTQSRMEALSVEALRYQWYAIEQAVHLTFRPGRFSAVALYVLVTESVCRRPWLEAAAQAIAGGADCLQLREKGLESGELLRRAHALVKLCLRHKVLCIINDRPDIAILARADGCHVGQDDLPARAARQLIGPDMLLGVSTHNLAQARRAVLDGADYVGVGPVFRSSTKPRDFLPGLDFARQITEADPPLPIPAVAIAGIHRGNVDEVLATGLHAVAVSSAVLSADDVRAAAAELKKKLVNGAASARPFPKDTDVPTRTRLVDRP